MANRVSSLPSITLSLANGLHNALSQWTITLRSRRLYPLLPDACTDVSLVWLSWLNIGGHNQFRHPNLLLMFKKGLSPLQIAPHQPVQVPQGPWGGSGHTRDWCLGYWIEPWMSGFWSSTKSSSVKWISYNWWQTTLGFDPSISQSNLCCAKSVSRAQRP